MANKKEKDPAFLFYPSDFLTETADLDFTEKGQFIVLESLQFIHGHLSEKIIELNVAKIDQISSSILTKFLIDKDGKYYIKALDEIIKKRKEYSNKQRDNAYKRWGNTDIPTHMQMDMPTHMPNSVPNTCPRVRNRNRNKNINEINNNSINNVSNNLSLYEYIESNFGRTLNSIEYEIISFWEDNELTRYAIKQTVLNNVRNIKYIQTILKEYEINGIKSVVEAQELEKKFKKEKNNKDPVNKLQKMIERGELGEN